jgi:hypothetical protein
MRWPPSGSGGACGAPLVVMNAWFTHSSPARTRQSVLLNRVRLSESPKTLIAAHHLVASQDGPDGSGSHPGG